MAVDVFICNIYVNKEFVLLDGDEVGCDDGAEEGEDVG